ncbi:hypothetical protein IW261DRAFT_1566288 [Armillaria novae-zelandiae]|uniref:Uncharacterized protein n=1 Tax=Armillaria novae-zelandiae TaxID=153914 RepID=A0AA39P4E5_9AGAR|nr:hypothetical protein IW261DRAFT_1566288 [Armillaria novae-zelandiae]
MKFTTLFSLIPALAGTLVAAGTFNSPTSGQTISANEPFNLTWSSGRYFKENSISITVLLTEGEYASKLYGTTLVKDLQPTTTGLYKYYSDLTPSFFYGSERSGNFQIVVLETYTAYSGIPATSTETLDVVIA